MELHLRADDLRIFPDLRSYVERRLGYALGRRREAAPRATVSLKSRTAARATAAWCCVIRIRLRGLGTIRTQALRPLPSEAIDDAVARLGERVGRAARAY